MARTTHQPKARDGEEIWETTTPGTVWVLTLDERGREKSVSVGGSIGQRLRLKAIDREICQDRIIEDGSDPFTNGLLKRIDGDQNLVEQTQTDQALSTEELMTIYEKTGMAFQSAVKRLNELNVRRLREVAETLDAKASQIAFLEGHIETTYKKGGDTATYRELKGIGEVAAG